MVLSIVEAVKLCAVSLDVAWVTPLGGSPIRNPKMSVGLRVSESGGVGIGTRWEG